MLLDINADSTQAVQVQILHVVGRRLEQHLELVVMLKAIGVLAVAAVGGTTRGLHISRAPRGRTKRTKRCRGMERARTHLVVVGLKHDASVIGPIALKIHNDVLERRRGSRAPGGTGNGRFGCHCSPYPTFPRPLERPLFPLLAAPADACRLRDRYSKRPK